jgi:hypothetical protein
MTGAGYYWRIFVGVYSRQNLDEPLGKKTVDIYDDNDERGAMKAAVAKVERGLMNPRDYWVGVLTTRKMFSTEGNAWRNSEPGVEQHWAHVPEFHE